MPRNRKSRAPRKMPSKMYARAAGSWMAATKGIALPIPSSPSVTATHTHTHTHTHTRTERKPHTQAHTHTHRRGKGGRPAGLKQDIGVTREGGRDGMRKDEQQQPQ